MKQKFIFKTVIVVFSLFIFTVFNFAFAQDQNQYYQQQQQQYQINQPPTNTINIPSQQEPSPTARPESTIQPREKTAPIQEKFSTPVVSSESLPLPPQTVNTDLTSQSNLPSNNFYVLYVVAALAVVFFFDWWRKWMKRKKTKTFPAEKDDTVCPTCGGTGKVTKKRTKTAPCGHCKGKGIDICHHCSGTGRSGGGGFGVPLEDIENYPKDCPYCGGKGFPKIVLSCEFCKGKGKIEYQESYEETCPTCKGSGRVPK